MNGRPRLSGPALQPVSGKPPRQLVVLLHGIGADGYDLANLATQWARHMPTVEFLSPHAPFPCDMSPTGYQWFSLKDRTPARIMAGVQEAADIFNPWLDDELDRRGLTDDNLALVGFSQGSSMSLFVAYRRPRACAAVLGYSGRLVGKTRLADEIRARPETMLIHGDLDQTVPPEALAEAATALEGLGVKLRAEMRPGVGHAIDPDGAELGLDFLRGVFMRRMAAARGDANPAT